MILKKLKAVIKFALYKKQWYKKNSGNFTHPADVMPLDKISIGNCTYGRIDAAFYGNDDEYLQIGHYVSISREVKFITSGGHTINTISSYPFKVNIMGEKWEAGVKGKITIGDDVWIGMRATILSGVTIGQGAVVGAGAVVTSDIPPYAVAVGVPARVIKYRFDEETIAKLMRIDYSKLSKDEIKTYIDDLYRAVDKDTDLSWLPMKE